MTNKQLAVLAGSIGAIILAIVLSAAVRGSFNRNLAAEQQTISDIMSRIDAREAARRLDEENRAEQEAAILSAGLDTARVERDNGLAASFLQDVMTWDSYAAYDGKRSTVKTGYQLSDDSTFMCLFLPARWAYPSEDEMSGMSAEYRQAAMYKARTVPVQFNERIDNRFGSNPNLANVKTYVTGISSSKVYSYLSVVKWSNMQSNGSQRVYQDVFCYKLDEDGVMSKLEAFELHVD